MAAYNPLSRKYGIGEDWKLVDQFGSTYWSGQDVAVYANDILLEDALQINYQVSEQVRPYYGYASYTAQKMYHGARIIAGELSLNFKRDGYIFSLLDYLTKSNKGIGRNTPPQPQQTSNVVGRQPLPFLTDQGEVLAGDIENLTPDQIAAFAKNIKAGRMAATQQISTPNGSYEAVVKTNQGAFQTTESGFDLTIVYGANLAQTRALQFQTTQDFYSDGAVTQPYNYDSQKSNINCTGVKLIGVSIMGQARSLNDSGQVYIETYSFQARDLQVLEMSELLGLHPNSSKTKLAKEMNPENTSVKSK